MSSWACPSGGRGRIRFRPSVSRSVRRLSGWGARGRWNQEAAPQTTTPVPPRLLLRWRTSDHAYWKAESYYGVASALTDQKAKEKALKQAILAYQVVLEDTKSEKADSALYKIGLAFEQLGFKEEAAVFYDELINKHATSPLVGDAKKRLKQVGGVKKKKAGK